MTPVADELDFLYQELDVDPASVTARALGFAEDFRSAGDPDRRARALRVAGLGRLRQGDALSALELLDLAVAEPGVARQVQAEIEMSRVGPLAELGRTDEARLAATRSVEGSTGLARTRADVQRTVLEFRIEGRRSVVDRLTELERELVAAGDDNWVARLWLNRSLMLSSLGDNRAADRDVERLIEFHRRAGAVDALQGAMVLRAELAAERGDLLAALAALEEAGDSGPVQIHRADVFHRANLMGEAIEATQRAIEWFSSHSMAPSRGTALLGLASKQLDMGLLEEGAHATRSALTLFDEVGQAGSKEQASLLLAEIEHRLGRPVDLEQAQEWAEAMVTKGLTAPAAVQMLRLIELCLEEEADLDEEMVDRWLKVSRTSDRLDVKIQRQHVMALRCRRRGDRAGVGRAIRRGMSIFDDHLALLGATEMRVHAGRRVASLGRTALRWAAESRPAGLLQWMERTRAASMRATPVVPPDDPRLVDALTELRAVEERLRLGDRSVTDRHGELIAEIRRRTRLAEGDRSSAAGDLDMSRLSESPAPVVAFEEVDGRIRVVAIDRRRIRSWDGGPAAELANLADSISFALQRLARGGSQASMVAARQGLTADAADLTRRLLGPLRRSDGVVISPPSRFHSLPFSVMEVDGPIAITPSLGMWLDRAVTRPRKGTALLVAGVDLDHADREVKVLAGLHPTPIVLTSDHAQSDRVVEGLESTALAHFACHGSFRSDNPLFSTLRLSDGGFNVYQWQALRSVPSTVVLSACDAGLSKSHPGNELMGLMAGILGAGARSVIASVGLYPDTEETIAAMEALHRHLLAGLEPSAALARVRDGGSVASLLLSCFGV